jgi:MATE family multidrug resistance protein
MTCKRNAPVKADGKLPTAYVTHGQVWRLAGPIMLSNLTVPLLGAVDTAVVGHLPGPQHLGGVALGSTVFSVVYWAFVFLRKGTTGLTAQAHGADNGDEVRATLTRALLLAAAIGAALIMLQWPFIWAAFKIVDGSTAVESLARDYVSIRIWGAPAAMANFVLLGWFVGLRNTRAVLVLQLMLNGVNILLDILFVVGFGWGVAGVAWATLIAEYGALAASLWVVKENLVRVSGRLRRDHIFLPDQVRRLLSLNRDIVLRTLCLVFAFAFFTAQGARQGDVILAANAVLNNFVLFLAFGMDGFANAAEALIGSAYGVGDVRTIRRALKLTALWGFIFSLGYAAIFASLGDAMIGLLTDVPEVVAATTQYFHWVLLSPFIAFWSYLLDGVFVGATRARDMRNAMAISLVIYLACFYSVFPVFGNDGLWFSLMVLFAARAVTLAVRYPALERAAVRPAGDIG